MELWRVEVDGRPAAFASPVPDRDASSSSSLKEGGCDGLLGAVDSDVLGRGSGGISTGYFLIGDRIIIARLKKSMSAEHSFRRGKQSSYYLCIRRYNHNIIDYTC